MSIMAPRCCSIAARLLRTTFEQIGARGGEAVLVRAGEGMSGYEVLRAGGIAQRLHHAADGCDHRRVDAPEDVDRDVDTRREDEYVHAAIIVVIRSARAARLI